MAKTIVAFRSFTNAPKNRPYFTEDTTWVHYKDNRLMLLAAYKDIGVLL
jgi:hypothetical protein